MNRACVGHVESSATGRSLLGCGLCRWGTPADVPRVRLTQPLPFPSLSVSLHVFLAGWWETGLALCPQPLQVLGRAGHPRPGVSGAGVTVGMTV